MNTRVEEWNMCFHVLNMGFRISASGDGFPCMSGERVGIGRVCTQVDRRLLLINGSNLSRKAVNAW